MDRRDGGRDVLCEKAAADKIGLERSFSCVGGELAGKKVGSLIRLSQTYPSSATANHPMAGTHFLSTFHQPSYTLSLCYKGRSKPSIACESVSHDGDWLFRWWPPSKNDPNGRLHTFLPSILGWKVRRRKIHTWSRWVLCRSSYAVPLTIPS